MKVISAGDLSEYQTHYLFLLIGTNPLPNLVSALLLSKNGIDQKTNQNSKIFLIHSNDTENYRKKLEEILKKELTNVQFPSIEAIEESEPSDIFKKISGILEKHNLLLVDSKEIGLNYTGGTKVMAVHAYQTIKWRNTEKNSYSKRNPVLSYLDARSLAMKIEKEGENAQPIRVIDNVHISLKELLELHDYCFLSNKEPATEVVFADLLDKLLSRGFKAIKQLSKDLKAQSQTKASPIIIPSQYNPFGNEDLTLDQLSDKLNTDTRSLKIFIEGKWLENYVLKCIKEINEEETGENRKFSDQGMGIQIIPTSSMDYRPISQNDDGNDDGPPGLFEIDDYVIKGYQLFAISCTTSDDKKTDKHKLYQIFVHAKQMGGDEARVGLICFYDRPETLQMEIELEWQTNGMLRVFGIGDLPTLKVQLKDWFNGQPTKTTAAG